MANKGKWNFPFHSHEDLDSAEINIVPNDNVIFTVEEKALNKCYIVKLKIGATGSEIINYKVNIYDW